MSWRFPVVGVAGRSIGLRREVASPISFGPTSCQSRGSISTASSRWQSFSKPQPEMPSAKRSYAAATFKRQTEHIPWQVPGILAMIYPVLDFEWSTNGAQISRVHASD